MARFIRDEKRTYPLAWLTIGGLFAAATVWAVYAEFVTRVPWQKHQQAFFEMELEQSEQGLSRAKGEWKDEIEPSLNAKIARRTQLQENIASGEYSQAQKRLVQLNDAFAAAEVGKTFSGSDLDEAYYYRNLAEYQRDKAMNEVRELYHEAFFSAEKPEKGDEMADAIYADPPLAEQGALTPKMWHLTNEVARMQAHLEQIKGALGSAPNKAAMKALLASEKAEQEVVTRLGAEMKHQTHVDDAVSSMAKIDGPADPPLTERDPQKRAEEQKRERSRVCAGNEDTRNCLKWLQLEPVDVELKAIDVEISKGRRTLTDAELREGKAKDRAHPQFNPANLIASLVGPYQIQQTVVHWIDYDRDVDREQVDRCQTCHMGSDAGTYKSASIPAQFRTHPHRTELFAAHPIEKFGCTSCHQGQGRATDMLSHSGWHLESKFGEERWHFAGDHYWDDPLLPVGALHKIVVDADNDEFAVKLPGMKKFEEGAIKLDRKSPEAHAADEDVATEYKDDAELFGAMQAKIQEYVAQNADLAKRWHAVVRRVDNRVEIGLDANDPGEHISSADIPAFGLKIAKPELAMMLGWPGAIELTKKQALYAAPSPPSVPVRSDGMAKWEANGRYHPPRGEEGLQVPDEMRNRFIQSLPEVQSGCLRCHQNDVDLRPRGSKAKYISAKLAYEHAEADRAKDPAGYPKAHEGSDELPNVPPDPSAAVDPVPTFSEGRALFKKLNCTGCHILENYPWDKNSGPALDNVTAKTSPSWILTWIRNPRGWRAKTRMPNLWPKPLDPASKRPFPAGSPEYQKWEAQMREETVAVASFLVERSDNPSTRPGSAKDAQPLKAQIQGYADVPDATAEKGKQVFEAYGCQGCHARSEHDTPDEPLPDAWKHRERDIAPTLSNMADKTTADWIAYWVEEPNRYWHGTKMPNLRLSRLEAASVGKYVSSLKEAPLNPASVDSADVAIVKDPQKRAEKVACGVASGTPMSRVECGERVIAYYGCFGCHNVSGFEKNAPVAPELGGFAKKDVTTLDFGYAIAEHHLQTTETFATLKLDSPRIYRRDRIDLKMGDFDLSPREIRSLVTFLKGLVQSRPKEEFNPNMKPTYSAALEGRQLVEDYNCRACHVIEDRGADIDGFRGANLAADPQARAPYLTGEGKRVQPEWLFSFLRDPGKNGIRPWLHPEWAYGADVPAEKRSLRMPTFNLSPEQVTAIVRYFATWDGEEYPYQAPAVNQGSESEKLYALTYMLSSDAANCLSCHFQGEFPVQRGQTELAKMAPNFNEVARRLRPAWVKEWLLRPQNWLPYTKMTAFWATKDRSKDSPFWPAEGDPFASKPIPWNKVPGLEGASSEQQVEMIRNFLFSLPHDAVFPKPGAEASSPLVKNQPVDASTSAANKDDGEKDKGKDKDKKGKDKTRRTGSIGGPARL